MTSISISQRSNFQQANSRLQWSLWLARLALLLAVAVVLLGGWTRLNDAGLSCPDWPGCYGEWVLPSSAEQQAQIQGRYPHQPLDLDRGWIEMSHRYLAGTLGLLIAGLAGLAWQQRHVARYPLKLSGLLLVLVTAQALFGMWTVTMKLLPQVVTLHLLGGMLTFALLLRLNQCLGRLNRTALPGPAALVGQGRGWVMLVLLLLGLQIGLGGWTSANYAGWSCSHWLLCEPESPPELDFSTAFSLPDNDGRNFQGGQLPREARAAIQLSHRLLAAALLASVLVMIWRLRKRVDQRPWLAAVLAAVVVQMLLGIANVVLALPLALAFAHHAMALLLLTLLLLLYGRTEGGSDGG